MGDKLVSLQSLSYFITAQCDFFSEAMLEDPTTFFSLRVCERHLFSQFPSLLFIFHTVFDVVFLNVKFPWFQFFFQFCLSGPR